MSFLIDAAPFYKALFQAMQQAQEQILMVGWDTDSRTSLLCEAERESQIPHEFGSFLAEIVARRPELRIYILSWDFTFIYSLEREPLPATKFDGLPAHQVRFVLDGQHPLGASHHQKVIVIDDSIAFTGGLDVTMRRWDTPEHLAVDPRRTDPIGKPYGPFHDIQSAVDGEAAQALGDLVRERWLEATGESLPRVQQRGDRWPEACFTHVRNVDVGIARTKPPFRGRPGVYEVEKLFLDSIAKARRFIYIENQYFTNRSVARALIRRLQEKLGPEIILVVPRDATGLMEESTMGVLRARVLNRMRKADRYNRLRVFFPTVPGLERPFYVKVHSKMMIIDDEFLRIGSANLNNRSMGLDTECDVAIEARGRPEVRSAIAELRSRLLGEHLGVDPVVFEERFRLWGSLLRTVESFREGERTLLELDWRIPAWLDLVIPRQEVIDPRIPFQPRKWFDRWFQKFSSLPSRMALIKGGAFFGALVAMSLAWRLTPLSEWVEPERIASGIEALRDWPFAPLLIVAGFVVGSLLLVPLTVLIIATALALNAVPAFIWALVGSLCSAMVTYWLGSRFGQNRVKRLSNSWIQSVNKRIRQGGIVAVAVVRMLPVAPFTIVNLVAGATHIRFRDYMIGTLIGIAPGLGALTLVGHRLESMLRDPGAANIAALIAVFVLVLLFMRMAKHRFVDRFS